jgi:hypothetical protein
MKIIVSGTVLMKRPAAARVALKFSRTVRLPSGAVVRWSALVRDPNSLFSVNPIRRDANTYADADTNQGQHVRMSRTCCAFDDSVCMSATLRHLVRESERCAVF